MHMFKIHIFIFKCALDTFQQSKHTRWIPHWCLDYSRWWCKLFYVVLEHKCLVSRQPTKQISHTKISISVRGFKTLIREIGQLHDNINPLNVLQWHTRTSTWAAEFKQLQITNSHNFHSTVAQKTFTGLYVCKISNQCKNSKNQEISSKLRSLKRFWVRKQVRHWCKALPRTRNSGLKALFLIKTEFNGN